MADIFEFLITKVGLEVTAVDNHGCNPLHYACFNTNLCMVKNICNKASQEDLKEMFERKSLKDKRVPMAKAFIHYPERQEAAGNVMECLVQVWPVQSFFIPLFFSPDDTLVKKKFLS